MELQMDAKQITSAVEGILFAAGEPVQVKRLAAILELDDGAVEYALVQLETLYNEGERGIRLLRMEDSVQFCSAPEYADVIRQTLERRRVPQLSPTAFEVLAIVAYFQPVTRAYVERVRGVDSSYTMGSLHARGLIESCGQLQVPGRPTLYQTTNAFLRSFNLTKLDDLPPLPDAEDSEAKAQLQEAIEAIVREQEAAKQAEAEAEEVAQELRDSLFHDETASEETETQETVQGE
ncbi:MAG: SMC-Scp complex subunit ScpB [Oscillospiraceae bacterium]|nr:SMC-Scp complex subunit ScpB [Oscillospiraceae bacterium]